MISKIQGYEPSVTLVPFHLFPLNEGDSALAHCAVVLEAQTFIFRIQWLRPRYNTRHAFSLTHPFSLS
jgi:hypothetical protein